MFLNLKILDVKIFVMISVFKYVEDLGFYLEIFLEERYNFF